MSHATTPSTESEELTLNDLVVLLWGGRWILLGCIAAALVLGVFYAWRATPIYQVSAMLQVESKKAGKGNAALAAVTEGLFEVSTEAQAEVEIIRSNLVLGRAVEALHLDVVATPDLNRLVGPALARRKKNPPRLEFDDFEGPRGIAFRLAMDGAQGFTLQEEDGPQVLKGKVGEDLVATWQGQPFKVKVRVLVGKEGQAFNVTRLHAVAAVEALRKDLSVAEKGKQTNILGLTYLHRDPVKGADILNAVLDQYVRQNIERKAEEASKTLAFLQDQMPLLKGKLEAAEERLNQFRAGSGSADLTEEAKLVLRQSVELEGQVLALRQKREEVLRTYQEKSDVISTLDQQIGKLQGEGRRLEGMVKGLPRTQQEVVRLMRDVQVNQELYTALMNNVQQLQVAKAGEIGNARIVDHATPGLKPVKPEKTMIVGLATMLGFLAGIGVLMVQRALHRGVENPQVLEAALGLPVLVTIPHSPEQEGLFRGTKEKRLLADNHPEDLAVESLRSLRTSLHFAMVDAPNKVVMIAGPAPQIGKSFVSANFAAVLAQGGARVLLVDADMRKGKLHRQFGLLHRKQGLSEILSGELDWKAALRKVGDFNLITTGTVPPNPAELLMGPRLETFLEEAAEAFDIILVDTPPILAVTDAMVIGAHAGAVLLALKAGKHPLEEVRTALQRLENAGIKPRGMIFNDIHPISSRYGYHKYAYHYGYSHQGE